MYQYLQAKQHLLPHAKRRMPNPSACNRELPMVPTCSNTVWHTASGHNKQHWVVAHIPYIECILLHYHTMRPQQVHSCRFQLTNFFNWGGSLVPAAHIPCKWCFQPQGFLTLESPTIEFPQSLAVASQSIKSHIVRLSARQREFECQLLPPEHPELSVIKSLAEWISQNHTISHNAVHSMYIRAQYDNMVYHIIYLILSILT